MHLGIEIQIAESERFLRIFEVGPPGFMYHIMLEKFAMTLEVNVLIAMTTSRRGMSRSGLYESSRAVTLVDGLPRAPSFGENAWRKIPKLFHKNEDIS